MFAILKSDHHETLWRVDTAMRSRSKADTKVSWVATEGTLQGRSTLHDCSRDIPSREQALKPNDSLDEENVCKGKPVLL